MRAPHTAEASSRVGIHRAERRRHHEKNKRRPERRFDEHHAAQGVDVQQSLLVQQPAQPVIHRAGLAEQQQPADGVQDERRAEGGERGEISQAPQRRIRPRDDPGHQAADQRRQQSAADREIDCIEKRLDNLEFTKEIRVKTERELIQLAGERGGKETGLENRIERRKDEIGGETETPMSNQLSGETSRGIESETRVVRSRPDFKDRSRVSDGGCRATEAFASLEKLILKIIDPLVALVELDIRGHVDGLLNRAPGFRSACFAGTFGCDGK
jgi:hypothetical protein